MTASYSIHSPNYIVGGHRELLAALRQNLALPGDSRMKRIAVESELNHQARRDPEGLGTSGFIPSRRDPEPPASLDAVFCRLHQVQEGLVVVKGHYHYLLPVEHLHCCHFSPFDCAGSLGVREPDAPEANT